MIWCMLGFIYLNVTFILGAFMYSVYRSRTDTFAYKHFREHKHSRIEKYREN